MSAYDFNHHKQELVNNNNNNNNHHHNVNHNLNGNGTQLPRYQVDNDYMNRGYSSGSTNNLEMSVQLTRPTSKTAMLVRQRRAMLEQLSCFLCKGYLIDATTIDECMDSFCKSCIVIYLRNHNNCPKCGTLIHKTNSMSNIRLDKVLQDIVYKLVPGLYDDEMRRRREFYRNLFGTSSSSSSDDDEDESSGSFTGGRWTSEQYGAISHPKPFYKPTDSIDLSIEPQTRGDSSAIYYDNKRKSIVTCFAGNLQQQPPRGSTFSVVESQQFKTYLRCPAKLTALQLKKFIAAKFNICRDDTIHLLYLNESLKDEYSLIDIAYIYDWRGIEPMRLYYIIERDLSRSSDLVDHEAEAQSNKIKTRHSVGTSTQTVKRVCIDPHPKFYEEKNNNHTNNSVVTNTNGRSMRPRPNETHSNPIKAIANNPPQAPILRSYGSSSRDGAVVNNARSNTSNGIPNRELMALSGQQASRSQTASSVAASAMNELSRLRQESSKDTRSSSKKNTTESARSIPKININLNSLNRSVDSNERNVNTYSKINMNDNQREVASERNNVGNQIVPYERKVYTSAASLAGPSQSSMVTLASFTEARSNHVVAMSSNSAATISSSYKNILDVGTPCKMQTKLTSEARSNYMTKQLPSTPQLAFSFVTERGITIVRRLNNQEDLTAASASSSANTTKNISGPINPSTSAVQGGSVVGGASRSTPSHSPANTNQSNVNSNNGGSSQSIISSAGHDGSGSRHHLKVKPVYKTFVDPTKLKSPNFKKLGYTARH